MFIFLGLAACMPKIWQAQCENNGNCEKFSVVSISEISEKPFEISRADTQLEVRLKNFQLTDQGMLTYTEGRELCRGFHTQTTTYQVSSDKKRHARYTEYQFQKDELVRGDYLPCDEWHPTDDQTQLAVQFRNGTEPIFIPLTYNNDNEFILPFSVMGWGMLQNPDTTELSYQAQTAGVTNDFSAPLPERNLDWICDAMQSFQEIAAVDDYKTWDLIFESSAGILTIPYVHGDNPRLSSFSQAISQCDSNIQNHIKATLVASAAKYPKSRAHINYQYKELFGRDMRRGRRRSSSSKKSSTTSTKTSGLTGTYRCSVQGQVAYLRIDRAGKFNLKVELKNGSAHGTCSGNTCEIDNIYKSAITFTGGIERFTIRERGNALVLNDSTRCVRR